MRYIMGAVLMLFSAFFVNAQESFEITVPDVVVEGVEFDVTIHTTGEYSQSIPVTVNGRDIQTDIEDFNTLVFSTTLDESGTLELVISGKRVIKNVEVVPLWMSVLPPLIAILLALLLKEVITSLFIGIFSGTLIMALYSNGGGTVLGGFLATVDTYIMNAMTNWGHIAVIVFSMSIAAVVSIISRNGGMRGVVNLLEPYARNPRSGQFVIWLMGVLIFFDDYANTLVVGNTMRPVADRLKISREKLAYLVDSTAAPVAAIAFITTWIGAELGYIETGMNQLSEIPESPYSVFLHSLKYAFYPIFTLAFMLMLIYRKRDFGAMHKAETKARQIETVELEEATQMDKEFEMKEGVKPRAFNAIVPIVVVIFGAILGMWFTGVDATDMAAIENEGFFRKLSIVIGNSDSYTALLWSSLSGMVVAVLLSVSQRIMNLEESIHSGLGGFKTMIPAMIILILAWSLAGVTEDMHTAVFLQGLWSPSLSPVFIPAVIFILSGLVAFSTGSSWGTMAILYPLLLPASYHIAIEGGMDHDMAMVIFYNVVSVVLAGAVFGDHCSPISDTTILSSLATSCNHLDHVKTQMPYAMTVGVVSVVMGSIPAAIGIPSYITFPAGMLVLYVTVHFIGKPVNDY